MKSNCESRNAEFWEWKLDKEIGHWETCQMCLQQKVSSVWILTKRWINLVSYTDLPDCDSDLCRPDPSSTSESLLQICMYACIYNNCPQYSDSMDRN